MKFNFIVVLFALILFSSMAFAVAPVMSDINWTPKWEADLNYSNWNTEFILISSLVTGEDLNASDCYYTVNNGDDWFLSAVDMNTDTNIITIGIQLPSVTNDLNFGLKCINNASEESDPVYQRIWADSTPPTTVAHDPSNGIIILTATDEATTTGDGSGVQRIYYKLDNADWTSSTNNPLTLTITSVGNHTVLFCSTDNLDNNECTADTRTKSFSVLGLQNSACGLMDLIPIILAALLLVGIIFALKMGAVITPEIVIALVIASIVGVIAIVIYSTVVSGFCVV
jgi:hypothetical protein